MKKALTAAQRLIVAVDIKPDPREGYHYIAQEVLRYAELFMGTGVCLKVNSALRDVGYSLIDEIHARGLTVFADLKLIDISETLATDGGLLGRVRPEMITVSCHAGVDAMRALKAQLPHTEVLGVTVLTSHTEDGSRAMYGCSIERAVVRFARFAAEAGIDGVISSPAEAARLCTVFGLKLSINTPGIRPAWTVVPGDDQNQDRVMTPAKAIQAGADRIVVGRPILNHKSPRDAVFMTLDEIASAM